MNELLTMLDTKYKRLEYIESTGTQYIELNHQLNQNYEYNLVAEISSINNSIQGAVWGCRTSAGATDENILWMNNYNNTPSYRPTWVSVSQININYNKHSYKWNSNGFYFDNVLQSTSTLKVSSLKPTLFGMNNNGVVDSRLFSGKIYNYYVKNENSQFIINLVPVMRKSDNEIGMLDLVEGKFYPNAGTGKFTANLDTMYALIQGTPTVQDGRVSGFSSSSYLKINEVINFGTKDFEIKCCFIANALQNARVFATDTLVITVTGINVITTGVIRANFNVNGTRRYIDSSVQYLANVKYYVILYRQGETIGVKVSTDNINWTTNTQNINNSDEIISNTNFLLGLDNINSFAFSGSIDLNRSYIKIDDTKYNLQAVVGYTVVGSPTITDGVVSGFTTSDYLTLGDRNLLGNNLIFHCKFNSGNLSITALQPIFQYGTGSSAPRVGFFIENYSLSVFYSGKNSSVIYQNISTLSANTEYEIEFGTKDTKRYLKFGTVGNMIDIPLTSGSDTDFDGLLGNMPITIGHYGRNYNFYFEGSIDLNETYIKINNKLWFNGQQA